MHILGCAFVVFSLFLADQVNAGKARVIARDPGTAGPVYAYGWQVVAERFEFTNIGGDTLYLNGLSFDPARLNDPRPIVPTERDISAHQTSVRAGEAARRHTNAADQLKAMAREYHHSPDVESVRIGNESIYVTFKGEPGEIRVPLPRNEPTPPLDRVKYHGELIDAFAYVVNHGGLYAWGDGYRINSQPRFLSGVHEMIERACRGIEIDPGSSLVKETGFYQREFFEDLRLHKGEIYRRGLKQGK